MPASDNLPATYSPCYVFYNVCNTKLCKGPACLQDNYLDAIYRQNICLSEREEDTTITYVYTVAVTVHKITIGSWSVINSK